MPSAPLHWSAYEHDHIERGRDWYWALGIITASAALVSVLFGNIFFAILIITAALALGLVAGIEPDLVEFEVSDDGIRINDTLHTFEEILGFWVEERHERPILLVDTTKVLSPNLIIPIEEVDPRQVREFLRERTEERRMKEPFAHHVLEFFGL